MVRGKTRRGFFLCRIPYEQFLQQYGALLRGGASSVAGGGATSCDSDGENKENELLFEPLDRLYNKQLRMTPRRKSVTPRRRLRRRAGRCRHAS